MLSSYLWELSPDKYNKTLVKLEELIKKNAPKCNLVFGTGASGGLIVAALAAKMGISWGYVRKEGLENTHASYEVEVAGVQRFSDKKTQVNAVFIDDLIDSGASYKRAKKKLKENLAKWGQRKIVIKFLGAALYDEGFRFVKK